MTAYVSVARAWVARNPLLADAALALLVLAVTLQPLLLDERCGCPPQPAWAYVLVVAQCLPLAWRHQQPFLVGLLVGLLSAAHSASSVPEPAVPFAALVAVYSVAAHVSRRLLLISAVSLVLVLTVALLMEAPYADVQDYTVNYLIFGTAWLLGDGARTRRERAHVLEARIEAGEQLRAAEAERVLADERARIARELHDVVAHAVSLMVVQAEAGPVVVRRDADRAIGAFDAISATGKQALTELRRLLSVLRTDPDGPLTPQPGLDGLSELVQRCREAGLAVVLEVAGTPRPLPPGVDLSAYRIAQEALTNTLKHAGPARATVRVRYDAEAVEVQVHDERLPDLAGSSSAGSRGGNGLVGMRERVQLLGGTLTAGPVEGGWSVSARLPAPSLVGS